MLKPDIDKSSIINLEDSQITFGKERNTSRWWVRYDGLGLPVWTSAERKQLIGLIVQLTTLNGLRSLKKNVNPNERYREEIIGSLDCEIKSYTRHVRQMVSIDDNRIHHKVKFVFDSTENIRSLDDMFA